MYGTNIKRIREKKNITQEGLAKRIGVSRQAVCMWETGKRELKGTMLNRIAQIFSVPVSEILSEGSIKISLTGKGDSMKEAVMSMTKKRGKDGEVMKKSESSTTFTLAAPKASKVALTGSFNSWSKSGAPLKKEKDGIWKTDLTLKPGRHEYKFIVDGQWWTDPANKNIARNSFGTENSVIEIKG